MRKWKGLVPKPSKYLEAFLRRLKMTQIKELWILFKLHILLHSSKPPSLSLKRKKKSREGMKDILFSLVMLAILHSSMSPRLGCFHLSNYFAICECGYMAYIKSSDNSC